MKAAILTLRPHAVVISFKRVSHFFTAAAGVSTFSVRVLPSRIKDWF